MKTHHATTEDLLETSIHSEIIRATEQSMHQGTLVEPACLYMYNRMILKTLSVTYTIKLGEKIAIRNKHAVKRKLLKGANHSTQVLVHLQELSLFVTLKHAFLSEFLM